MGEKKSKKEKPKKRPMTYGAKGIEVVLGHQYCTPKGRFPYVPHEMGWLWTSRDILGFPFRPDWRPGAVRRSVVKLIKRYSRRDNGPEVSKIKKKFQSKTNLKPLDLDNDDDDRVKPTFIIRKVDGDYVVTLQQIKDIKTRRVNDYPYTDDPPYCFKVLNKTSEEAKIFERKKEQLRQYTEGVLFQEAFDKICRDIYRSTDKVELGRLAKEKDTCPCKALETEILENFAQNLSTIPEAICTALEEPVEEESWCIEFTPPIAKYDPNRKMKETRYNKATQYEIKGSLDDDEDNKRNRMKSGTSFSENLITIPIPSVKSNTVIAEYTSSIISGENQNEKKPKKDKKEKPKVDKSKDKDKGKDKDKDKDKKDEKKGGGGGGGGGNFMKDKERVEHNNDSCCRVDPCFQPCKTYCDPCCYDYCDSPC